MKRYKRWQGIRAAHVQIAKRDGVTAAGPGWIEVKDDFPAGGWAATLGPPGALPTGTMNEDDLLGKLPLGLS